MCGIAGGWSANAFLELKHSLPFMTKALAHRGPDDFGHWYDEEYGVALGHRRLAIVELSPLGHQPMLSATGRYCLVYNGEVYNHAELRAELESRGETRWRGHSDTETIAASFDRWGIEGTLRRAVGMFAFAVWDRAEHCLTLGRDRMGEKPLYYGLSRNGLAFASELSAIAQAPEFNGNVNRDAIAMYLRYAAVPSPHSIYQGIHKLPPGSTLRFTASDLHSTVLPEPVAYWSVAEAYNKAIASPFKGSDADAVNELERLLSRSVKSMAMADVPLGAFLSGGIDSSTIVSLMQEHASTRVKTFTIGFSQDEYDESSHAKAIASHLGTDHTEVQITEDDLLSVVPKLGDMFSEPFADSSQIPTYLVSRLARQHVTVSLSGDAGDELFHGYDRYRWAGRLESRLNHVPRPARRVLATIAKSVPVDAWDVITRARKAQSKRNAISGDRIHKLADLLGYEGNFGLYRGLMTHWHDAEGVAKGSTFTPVGYDKIDQFKLQSAPDMRMAADLSGYLPDDILTKVDRTAMAVSLETRVPLLDHRVVEFAMSLPLELKQRQNTSKWILRQVLARRVPPNLFERPKMGFAIPLGEWLRGPLRDWAEDLLDEHGLREDGYFNVSSVRQKWAEHQSGQRDWQRHLWDVLMFQAWLRGANRFKVAASNARTTNTLLGMQS